MDGIEHKDLNWAMCKHCNMVIFHIEILESHMMNCHLELYMENSNIFDHFSASFYLR